MDALEMPAADAMSLIDAFSYPCFAKQARAALRIVVCFSSESAKNFSMAASFAGLMPVFAKK